MNTKVQNIALLKVIKGMFRSNGISNEQAVMTSLESVEPSHRNADQAADSAIQFARTQSMFHSMTPFGY